MKCDIEGAEVICSCQADLIFVQQIFGNDTNQNCVHEEIDRRLKSGNAYSHPVQNLLPSCLLFKNVKTKICKTVTFPAGFYGCETWSLTLR
jgi:hypothetical protein